LVFSVTGCYKPKVQSGGFACSTTDNPPCPSGFYCVNGLCVDTPGGGGGGGGGSGGGGGGGTVVDMSTPAGGGDMSMPAGDMAHSSTDMACFGFTYPCNGDPTCCAQCCAGGCAPVGWCAL
jgi:hypothetical protein